MATPEFFFCGELVCPSLEPLAASLVGCSWPVAIRRSGYDGSHYLVCRTDELDLEMSSEQSQRFVFSGSGIASPERALALLTDFSKRLAAAGVTHSVELYREAGSPEPFARLYHAWPSVV